MVEHLNAFQGLIKQTTYLHLGSLPDTWKTLVVTVCNVGLEGKHLSLEAVKSRLLNEEAHQKDREPVTNPKALVTEGDMNWGRGRNRSF